MKRSTTATTRTTVGLATTRTMVGLATTRTTAALTTTQDSVDLPTLPFEHRSVPERDRERDFVPQNRN